MVLGQEAGLGVGRNALVGAVSTAHEHAGEAALRRRGGVAVPEVLQAEGGHVPGARGPAEGHGGAAAAGLRLPMQLRARGEHAAEGRRALKAAGAAVVFICHLSSSP